MPDHGVLEHLEDNVTGPGAWTVLPLAPDVRLTIDRAMPVLDAATEAIVAHHWAERTARHALFNGRTFCADRVTPDEIAGHWTEYRRAIAQVADPALYPVLRQRGLAVCGVLVCPDGIAIGPRKEAASYLPGHWQLPPAGSVDQSAATPDGADWRHALLTELEEELGLDAAEIAAMRPLCLVQHPSGVLDMGVRMDTPLPGAEILARHRARGDDEYDRLLILPPERVLETIDAEGGPAVPTVRVFLEQALKGDVS